MKSQHFETFSNLVFTILRNASSLAVNVNPRYQLPNFLVSNHSLCMSNLGICFIFSTASCILFPRYLKSLPNFFHVVSQVRARISLRSLSSLCILPEYMFLLFALTVLSGLFMIASNSLFKSSISFGASSLLTLPQNASTLLTSSIHFSTISLFVSYRVLS